MRAHLLRFLFLVPVLGASLRSDAQFYNGSQQEFGKNRIQHREFLWQYYRFPELETYFYKGGRDLAQFVAISGHRHKKELEKFYDYTIDDRIQFVVYNSLTDFRQSNIGITGDEQYNVGGVTRIVGTKVFVYYEGDHTLLDRQVRAGVAQLILDQMLFGGNWRDVLKNSTLMSLPEWFTKGMVAYSSGPWDARAESRVRDAVLSGRFKKFNRLQGEEATLAGQAIWNYVAEVYGPSVIPNILYMTRVSRNPESGFTYVLGISLKTLTAECLDHYRNKFTAESALRTDVKLEELPVRTRRTRSYSQFKLSPDGRSAAWVSNELGQYKVWLYDRVENKVKRIAKGEKKINRIIDTSYPVLAWHPTGRALTWTTERKGELYLTTYTLDDRKKARKPVLDLQKILSMNYAPDGRDMVFSGVREGRTDLYLYHSIGNRQEQLTDDQYDDLDPAFVHNGTGIIFSSDRTDDTLRGNAPVAWINGAKDIFIYDLATRSNLLKRITATPRVEERQPSAYDSASYTFLSDAYRLNDRWQAVYDSAVASVDTTVHYRYFTTEQRLTDTKLGILEQDVVPQRGWYSQLMLIDGKYRFFTGRTAGPQVGIPKGNEPTVATPKGSDSGNTVTDDMSTVVKVSPRIQRDTSAAAIDIRNYRFRDEGPADPSRPVQAGTSGQVPTIGLTKPPVADTTLVTSLVFPEQRNYNVNFATDEVLTQLDNSYEGQFYQPLSGPGALNPGLSGLTRMAMSDLFEDYRVVGGFRLALDLNNNTYMLRFANLKRRLDKELVLYRQALQGIDNIGIVKLHTHTATYRMSYPFSELTSLRASVFYRNDRYVLRSIDGASLRTPNVYDHMAGAKLEYVYDSSLPFGLNLYTGSKMKVFGEYYIEPDGERTSMQVVGLDLRHSIRLHRELIWVNRLAGSSALGARKVLFFLGGVDNWLFAKSDNSTPIDFTENYWYQAQGVPVRGFWYNARNGNSFAVFNTELRVPIFRYLLNRPIRSDFFQNFQVVGFGDLGTAWTGSGPYADDNFFNQSTIGRNPLTITLKNQREPIIGGYGFGLRSRLLGYFVRADWGWGVDDGVIQKGVFHFSLSLDI
ncbi:MAG TPA: hypothetical protein VGE21_16760 [Flavobacteriales bacterium]